MRRRRDLPWRTTLKGIVVARDDEILLLEGSAAVAWDLLSDDCEFAELEALARASYPDLKLSTLAAAADALAREGFLES